MKINEWMVTSSDTLPIKKSNAARVLFFSDVHLLHKGTPTSVIIFNLMLLIEYVVKTELDAIYILGDLFDERDTLENADLISAIGFLNDLLELCKKKNIALRVLEGTPKHDRKQSKVVVELNKKFNIDLKYFDDITVFKDEKINKVVGLVPDEYRDDASETTRLFKNLMKSSGYNKLDIAGMHGLFKFQIPHVESKANFDERVWERMVKLGICIGHDHKVKQRGIIRILGSTDCLNHGEVGKKGVTVVDFYDDYAEGWFVLNPHPCMYLTVEGDNKTDEEIIRGVEVAAKKIKDAPHSKHGRLRVTYPHDSDIRVTLRSLSERYGIDIKPQRLVNKDRIVKINQALMEKVDEGIHLDKETISRILLERIESQSPMASDIIKEIEDRL